MSDHIILPPLRLKQIWQCRDQKQWVRIQRFNDLTCNGWIFDAIHPPIDWSRHDTISDCTFKLRQGNSDCYAYDSAALGVIGAMDLVKLLYEAPDVQ